MALRDEYDRLRDIINDCAGYRVLGGDDVVQVGDETTCASTLLAGNEDWYEMDSEFEDIFGLTVAQANDRKHNREMDAPERLFRRRVRP